MQTQIIDWEHASWDEGCAGVEKWTDRLGMPVDAGILETVVVLNLLGFRPLQLCEGHLYYGPPYFSKDMHLFYVITVLLSQSV